ncbi:signal transducer and activator of transcription 5B isoform X3 [Frankliniella occidentalis]|nr:signal transducer and activator of transcription 5B isoform X3 [Frankliniella occidentalis]XP_026271412.1 signal transducer and activator of transcription 5B isoform X3 [Frankliniella occidentalis]XP_026271413.1 signal transducer and activator of transcription 5B isoform X3 [Frankliniella occidentalis]
MALWARAQSLPPEALQQVRAIYTDRFPIEVRHFLASWIEEKMWSMDIDIDNPQNEQYASSIVGDLIQQLETKANSMNSEELVITKYKLMDSANLFKQRYARCPLDLFRLMRHCLNAELQVIRQVENVPVGSVPPAAGLMPDSVAEIAQQIDVLRHRTSETGKLLRQMEQEQEGFALHYHECTKLNAHLQHLQSQQPNQQNVELEKAVSRQKNSLEQTLNQKVSSLLGLRFQLGDKLSETVTHLVTLQCRVLDEELIRWKREQQLAGNGAQFNSNLDNIQDWCESLAEIIWHNRQQIKEVERLKQKLAIEPPGVVDVLPNLNIQITQLLSSLVTSTFIIEKQPPQVMKTNTRFTSTVRLLVGGKLNVHMTPPQVKVTIISEAQANALLKNDKIGKGEASGEILNNTGTMEYHQATRQLSVSFRNMQLKKIKRAEKKGTESVMDEKFSLLFQSQFSVGGGELVFQVWTLSLPVVVIVHGNQEPHAWATVTWDNAFAEPGRVPFAVPDKVPWCQVAEALNMKFRYATGRPLTEENLRFLAEKAFRNPNMTDFQNQMLTWSQFCKEPLQERSFTFWEWFYAVVKLTREHLRQPWTDGLILGFIRKKQAEDMLIATGVTSTFLLRFSDSELGGITIAWLGDGDVCPQVFMLQPFTSKDFAIRSLPDRIADLQHLVHLYPDIPKDQAFGKYYTPLENQPTSNNGYVKPFLVTHVPGWGGPGQSTPSYPNTPMFQAPSPEAGSARDTPSVASHVSDSVSSELEWILSYAGAGAQGATGEIEYASNMEFLDDPLDFNFDPYLNPPPFRPN